MKEVTIYRDSWLRGEGSTKSYLLRPEDNKMCCLGQVSYQFGVPLSSLKGIKQVNNLCTPPSALGFLCRQPDWFDGMMASTDVANDAMHTNDSVVLTPEACEVRITEILAAHNIKVTFVDGVAPWFLEEKERCAG